MRLIDTEDQSELRSSVRRFLGAKASLEDGRRLLTDPAGFDRDVWRQMADQLGLPGLAIPEQYGGSGFSPVEQGIVLQEMGRVLYGGPYLSSVVLAAPLLLALDDEGARADYLPPIAAGSLLATVALTEPGRRWDPANPIGAAGPADPVDSVNAGGVATTSARRSGDQWVLDGAKTVVVDGVAADLLLVVARAADGVGVFAVDSTADGLTRTGLPALDLTRRIASVTFTGTPARRIGSAADCTGALRAALDHALAGLAAEQVGGAEACLEMSVQYAGTRVQFGRPIGSFQAVKHRCADMLMRVEFAKAAAAHAAWAVADDPAEAPLATALAKAYCSDTYFRVAADTIQIHGGIGFTWEHPAHLYFRRAKSLQLFLGDAADQRARVAEHLQL